MPGKDLIVQGIKRVRGRALLVAAVALALTAGCSNSGGAANAPRPEKPVLNVAVVPAVDSAGFFVALNQGLFKAQGLTVNFIPVSSSETAIANQAAGAYDITGGNYVSYIQAQQEHRADLDIFAEGSVMEPGTQGIYTLPDSPVATLADPEGPDGRDQRAGQHLVPADGFGAGRARGVPQQRAFRQHPVP